MPLNLKTLDYVRTSKEETIQPLWTAAVVQWIAQMFLAPDISEVRIENLVIA